jgi:ATP-dependent Zn protease
MANALLEKETLDSEDIDKIMGEAKESPKEEAEAVPS